MKTSVHTIDGRGYSDDYWGIFSVARVALDEEIQHDVEYIRGCMKAGYHPSLNVLVIIANKITAYNELSPIIPFYKTKYF